VSLFPGGKEFREIQPHQIVKAFALSTSPRQSRADSAGEVKNPCGILSYPSVLTYANLSSNRETLFEKILLASCDTGSALLDESPMKHFTIALVLVSFLEGDECVWPRLIAVLSNSTAWGKYVGHSCLLGNLIANQLWSICRYWPAMWNWPVDGRPLVSTG
jgi:hypothetical protein